MKSQDGGMLPGSGNSVADYREKQVECPDCDGTGKKKCPDFLEGDCPSDCPYPEGNSSEVNCDNDGFRYCPNCNGTGKVLVRR